MHGAAQTGFCGDLCEGAIAIVVKELISVDVGQKQVRPAIVVIIAHRRAHAVTRSGHSGALRHVGECSIAVVVEEAI